MSEVGMNDYDIDRETITWYICEAERMRAEALTEVLFAWGSQVKKWGTSLGSLPRSLTRRGKWNLSVPAPHH
jgi:hypothetical protein